MADSPDNMARCLFASDLWPCGVLDLASWLKRRGLARTAVVPVIESDALFAEPGLYRVVIERLTDREDDTRPEVAAREVFASLGEAFIKKLVEWRPHVVGFRIEGGRFQSVCRRIRSVRRLADLTILIGGPTVTSHPRETLLESGADYAFVGEAESSLERFFEAAKTANSKDLAPSIAGLAYRWAGKAVVNTVGDAARGKASRCVASTRVVRENRLDFGLLSGFDAVRFDSLFFTGGRGCPGRCTFCSRLHGQQVRVKSAKQLLEEVADADQLAREGRLRVDCWPLFQHTNLDAMRSCPVRWAAIYDEDFFLDRGRAVRFFRLWSESPLRGAYRLSLQTNPCSLLRGDAIDTELLRWIDRLKPMVQIGAESFHPLLLERWHKRHRVDQLETVLAAMETTGQDYTIFHLLTDFDSTPEEVLDAVWLLGRAAARFPRMRIAASPFTIPLYDSDARRHVEGLALIDGFGPCVPHFTDYESPRPEWMDPLTAELADLADQHLEGALNLETRDRSLWRALLAIRERTTRWAGKRVERRARQRAAALRDQAIWQVDDLASRLPRFEGSARRGESE